MITIQTEEIPEEGLEISGKLGEDLFDLPPEDEVRPSGPVEYDLQVSMVGDLVLARGKIAAPFSLRCVCCLEDFPFTSRESDYIADFDLEETGTLIPLGDRIREDLLLTIPSYPHCDQGDDPDRVCPMAGQFEGSDGGKATEAPAQGSGAWDALDGLAGSGESGD